MSKSIEICSSCGEDLTEENTKEFDGFDADNYSVASSLRFGVSADDFKKCDDCFSRAIDHYLDNLYS